MTIFKKIAAFKGSSAEEIAQYLQTDFESGRNDLFDGLENLDFVDNFNAFQVDLEISGSTEVAIPNPLSGIPTKRLIVRETGGGRIVDGDTAWTVDTVYLQDVSGTFSTATVIFMI